MDKKIKGKTRQPLLLLHHSEAVHTWEKALSSPFCIHDFTNVYEWLVSLWSTRESQSVFPSHLDIISGYTWLRQFRVLLLFTIVPFRSPTFLPVNIICIFNANRRSFIKIAFCVPLVFHSCSTHLKAWMRSKYSVQRTSQDPLHVSLTLLDTAGSSSVL